MNLQYPYLDSSYYIHIIAQELYCMVVGVLYGSSSLWKQPSSRLYMHVFISGCLHCPGSILELVLQGSSRSTIQGCALAAKLIASDRHAFC